MPGGKAGMRLCQVARVDVSGEMTHLKHSESGRPGSNPEWGVIYYEASITAQGLPEPSSLRGSTLGTRAAEHRGCNWGMQVD